MSQEYWDERYRSRPNVWSGDPNPHLIAQAADVLPGAALDVGSGEGADAIWLAERGWRVTAIDFSQVALERAAIRASAVSMAVAQRIDWSLADLTNWTPSGSVFDLVSVQFMHLPPDSREALFRRLAAAVAPGGMLLIVGHHPADLQTTIPRPPRPELFFTASDIEALLDPGRWEVVVCAARPRNAVDPQGRIVGIQDAVFAARRRET